MIRHTRRFVRGFGAWVHHEIAALQADCFALVMATGIISNTLYVQGYRALAGALFAVDIIAYVWLALSMAWRAVRFPRKIWADFVNPRRTFSFFAIVAGTCLIGLGLDLRGFAALATMLWLLALLIWLILIYCGFGILIFTNTQGPAVAIHGGWLLAIVGTQSLVVLGATVGPVAASLNSGVFVLILALWGLGLWLYCIFITLLAHRIFFFGIEPDEITPVLWVVMGAAAITTNAGSTLVLAKSAIPFLQAMQPFIDDVAFLVWAWATWWIPLLLLLGLWKHGVRGAPLNYTPMLWSLVFPLGMYAMASRKLSLAADLPPLKSLSEAMIWIALAAWTATAVGAALSLRRRFRTFCAPAALPA